MMPQTQWRTCHLQGRSALLTLLFSPGDYSAQVGKDSVNQRYDDMVSVFQAMGKERIDHKNSAIFTAVDLEGAVDAVTELGLIMTANQDGPLVTGSLG